jgi:hypothetical protein
MRALMRVLPRRSQRLRAPWSTIEVSDTERRGIGLFLLSWMSDRRESPPVASLISVYAELRGQVGRCFPGLSLNNAQSGGKFGTFAAQHIFEDLLDGLVVAEDGREVRSIHKAKGDEFCRVLAQLDGKRGRIDHLLPCLSGSASEEQRVTYVAASRARDQLFMLVPELDDFSEEKLRLVGATVNREGI